MLIGREKELSLLREAILARRSLLVHGCPGAGKTALLEQALLDLPPGIRRKCLLCSVHNSPREIWRSLAHSLAEAGSSEVASRIRQECTDGTTPERWLARQTSLRLRGILRQAMRADSYWVFLDTAAPLPDGAYPLLQEWVWSRRTPLIVLARGFSEQELGRVARLYWHSGMRLELGPMTHLHLDAILDRSIAQFDLDRLADRDFRAFVFERAHGLPGAIVSLCRLASRTDYQSSGRLKLRTLAVDFLLHCDHGAETPEGSKHYA